MKREFIIVVVSIILFSFLSPVLADSQYANSAWPKIRFDSSNTGVSPYAGPERNAIKWYINGSGMPVMGTDGTVYTGNNTNFFAIKSDSYGEIKWNKNIGIALISSPVISKDGTIYYVQATEKPKDKTSITKTNLIALNPDGSTKWKTKFDNSVILNSPVIGSDNKIYLTSFMGPLYAFKSSGEIDWSKKYSKYAQICFTVPITDKKNNIYFGSLTDGKFYKYDSAGNEKWNFDCGDPKKMGLTMATPVMGKDGTVYFGCLNGVFYALYSANGKLKWKYAVPKPKEAVDDVDKSRFILAPATIAKDGTIYFASSDMDKMKTTLFALKYDGKKPIIKWTKKFNGVSSSGGLIDKNGIFYFATDDLYALYPNGKIKWTSTVSPSGFSSLALGKDGTLYAVSDKLYAIKDQQSDLFLTMKADKTNLNVGDVVKLQITVNDFAKDRAFDTLLTYKVPDEFNYWDAASKNGKLNFDPMKKIINWDLGTAYSRTNNVLYLKLFMKKAGTYTVKPNLSTSTYDPNLSQRIGSIELKVASTTAKYNQIGRHK